MTTLSSVALSLALLGVACSSDPGGVSAPPTGMAGTGSSIAGASAGGTTAAAGQGGTAAGDAGSGGALGGQGGSLASAGSGGVGGAVGQAGGGASSGGAVNHVPLDYVGTPYVALHIPGTVNAADYDRGGAGVAWCHDVGSCNANLVTGDWYPAQASPASGRSTP